MFKKNIIAGKKNKTVCYTLPNLEITEDLNFMNIKWDAFRFYTPAGNNIDEEGNLYFEVQALDETITRETLDKEIQIAIKIDTESNIFVIEKYLGTPEAPPIEIEGKEGDFVLWGVIPADPGQEINIEYKEVTDGS